MARPILVGESNPHSPHPGDALLASPPGSAGNRLWLMALEASGMTLHAYERAFRRVNLCAQRWSDRSAREGAEVLRRSFSKGDRVVLLGRRVQALMGEPPAGVTFYQVPHPSGRCRDYNDPKQRRRVGALLSELAHVPKRRGSRLRLG